MPLSDKELAEWISFCFFVKASFTTASYTTPFPIRVYNITSMLKVPTSTPALLALAKKVKRGTVIQSRKLTPQWVRLRIYHKF
jgi:hypothetical protein